MLTPEIAKDACIKAINFYLKENKIKYEIIESKSGSIYYDLKLHNGNPKIRVSDHNFHLDENYKLCSLSINYNEDFGKHSNVKKVKERVYKMLNSLIHRHGIYNVHRVFEKLNSNNNIVK